MENRLSRYSLICGIIVWLVSLAGIAFVYVDYKAMNLGQNVIFMPGAFEILLIVLNGSLATGVAFLAAVTALKTSNKRKTTYAAIAINGLFCIPVATIFVMQVIL